MHRILRWRGGGNRPGDSEMESSCESCSDEARSFVRRKKRKKGRGLLASFLDLFRKPDEELGGFFVPRRRRSQSRGRDCYPVGRWLGKTASLHRFQVPTSRGQADPTRKREYPQTPPRPPPLPPKNSTSPPQRRRRRNRSGGSQFSLFSISLEQKSRSMQSLLQGARARGGDSKEPTSLDDTRTKSCGRLTGFRTFWTSTQQLFRSE